MGSLVSKFAVAGGALGLSLLAALPVNAQATGLFTVDIGKACWVEGYTNTGATWTVTLTNGESTPLVLEGTGVNFAAMTVKQGSARFDVAGGVIGAFEATYGGNPMNARVKFNNGALLSDSGDPVLFHTIVGGEDGDDDDWQDLILNVTCLHHAG